MAWEWRIAGLGAEALAWADRARRVVPEAVFSGWDPDPHRPRLLDGIEARLVADPGEWWDGAASSALVPGAVLIDAALVAAERIAATALAKGLPVALVGTGGLAPMALRRLMDDAANRGLEARVLCGHLHAEDVLWAKGCCTSGDLGPLRSARFVRRGWIAAPAGSATPSRAREGRVVVDPARELWRIFDVALELGLDPVDLRVERAGPRAWIALARCDSGAVLAIDIDDRARTIDPPRWILEGERGSYGRGALRTTTPDGEIVEVPLERPDITGEEPLAEFVRCVVAGDSPGSRVRAGGARVARAMELAERLAG